MEDTLGGIQSLVRRLKTGLNPCFNGRYSRRKNKVMNAMNNFVLILVLMEDTLGVEELGGVIADFVVLILVLMEDTLGVKGKVFTLK